MPLVVIIVVPLRLPHFRLFPRQTAEFPLHPAMIAGWNHRWAASLTEDILCKEFGSGYWLRRSTADAPV